MAKTTAAVGLAQDDALSPVTADVKVDHEDRVVASTTSQPRSSSEERRRRCRRPSSEHDDREAAAAAAALESAAAETRPDDGGADSAEPVDDQAGAAFDLMAFLQTLNDEGDNHEGDDRDAALDDAIETIVDADDLVVLAGLYRRPSGRVEAIRRAVQLGPGRPAVLDRLHLIATRAACLDSMLALAEAGHIVSQHSLALMYSDRELQAEFESWLMRAADAGHVLSMMGMVSLLSQRDPQRSFAYARRAADSGLRTAQYIVGRCLIMGQGIQADLQAGLQYVVAAADAGLADAQVLAGGIFIQQHQGVDSDPHRAMRYFRMAADQNHPEALYILGSLLMAGSNGLDADPKQGARLIRRAAEADNPRAQLDLGKMYNAGEHVDEDLDEGFAWCLRAALHGLPTAAFIIGIMELEGMGCERNILAGCHWIERAAQRNHGEARKMLATLLSDTKIEEGFQDWKSTQSLLKIMAPSLRLNLVAIN